MTSPEKLPYETSSADLAPDSVELLQLLSAHSQSSIDVFEAVRDEEGRIIDFICRMTSAKSLAVYGLTAKQVIGRRVLETAPGVIETGLFERMIDVVETGQIFQQEHHFQADGVDGWFDTKMIRYRDGLLTLSVDLTHARRAEQENRQQARKLRNILDNIPSGLFISRAIRNREGQIVDFRIEEANPAGLAYYGMQVEDAVGRLASELFPADRQNGIFGRYVDVVETRKSQSFVFEDVAGGNGFWVEVLLTFYEDDCVIASTNNITSLKKAELAVLRQKELLQKVVNNTEAGMLLLEPVYGETGDIQDFRYVLTNAYNAKLAGRDVAGMTGRRVSELFDGWQQSDLFRLYVDVFTSGQVRRSIFPYREYNWDGWFDGSFSRVDDYLLYTYVDISRAKKAELEYQHQAELLERVMNTAATAIVVHESVRDEAGAIIDFRITQANQLAAEWAGTTVDSLLQQRLSQYFPDFPGSPASEQYKQVAETGLPVRFDYRVGHQWFDFAVNKFGDGIVVVVVDVTQAREYRQQLEQANMELRQSNDHLQQFAYVASHDLQEPLRKIQSFGTMLHEQFGSQLGASGLDLVDRMSTAAGRMQMLVRDLLTYSRLSTQREPFRAVGLDSILNDVLVDLELSVREKAAQVTIGPLPVVQGDARQLHHLFQNLISNAIKFQPEATSAGQQTPQVRVQARRLLRSELPPGLYLPAAMETSTAGRFWEVSVEDNGIGFDPQYVERIFQMFQRLHGKGQYAGTGIGLAICKKVAETHGGTITASSEPGRGSTFRVYLPVG